MTKIYQFCMTHWEAIMMIAYAMINVANSITSHYKDRKGVSKVLLYIVEVLSFVKTNGLKFPSKTGLPLATILIAFATCSACATLPDSLLKIETGTKALSAVAEPVMHARCTVEAESCKAKSDKVCLGWTKCDSVRNVFNTSIKGIHTAILSAYILDAANKKADAKSKMLEALKQFDAVYQSAKDNKLLEGK
jgi:hypothetical protein